jgi:hypothetical protein
MSKCTFTGCKTLENMHKPLMLKELRKLWNKEEPDLPWEEGDYSPSNTLLVNDSPYKALLNPVFLQPLQCIRFFNVYTYIEFDSHSFHVYLVQPHTAFFPRPYSYLNSNDDPLGMCSALIFLGMLYLNWFMLHIIPNKLALVETFACIYRT